LETAYEFEVSIFCFTRFGEIVDGMPNFTGVT